MKKALLCLLSFVLLLNFAACSNGKKAKSYYSDEAVKSADEAIELIDDFMENKIGASYAGEKIIKIGDDLKEIWGTFNTTLGIKISAAGRYVSFYGIFPSEELKENIKESRDSIYNSVYGE